MTNTGTGTDISAMQRSEANGLLKAAIESKDLSLVKFCLQKGADINAKIFTESRTPLLYLASSARPDMAFIKEIISLGGDISIKNYYGRTIFELVRSASGSAAVQNETIRGLLETMPDARPEFNAAAAPKPAATEKEIRITDPFHLAPPKGNTP